MITSSIQKYSHTEAVFMFVGNTDIIWMTQTKETPEQTELENSQVGVAVCKESLKVTGRSLKVEKRFLYLLLYKWVDGRSIL